MVNFGMPIKPDDAEHFYHPKDSAVPCMPVVFLGLILCMVSRFQCAVRV